MFYSCRLIDNRNFLIYDSAYTLGGKVGRIAGAIARLEARIEAKRLVFLPKSADAAPYWARREAAREKARAQHTSSELYMRQVMIDG